MPIKSITQDLSEVLVVNGTILSVTTFTNLELILKILLLVVSIFYTVDKWIHHKKQSDGQEKKIK
mgnify:CR=1 FL=1|tara:strand:- start:7510 stop:7704 length:195 start_codon:yes stop_codon:yes gene_type:complete